MKKYAPRKVFILENGEYVEITYEELCHREEMDCTYKAKLFIPLHGMIMEVDEATYRDFYKAKDRDEYLTWRTRHKDISYSQFDDDECSGEDMLVDQGEDVAGLVMRRMMVDKLNHSMLLLSTDEQLLIYRHYYAGIPETVLAGIYGISQQAISKRLAKIRTKLKNLIEN